jgi:methionine-rich copper-binding protein CopC
MSEMRPYRALLGPLLVALVVALGAPVALAHGDIVNTTPKEGTRVRAVPGVVAVSLAEKPAKGSKLVVTDGCRNEVSGEVVLGGLTLSAPVTDGQPGRWDVKLTSISAEDGHLVEDEYSFRVFGKKDCDGGADDEPTDDPTDVELGDPQPPLENDETSFPVVPFALGTLVLVGGALAVRRFGSKS